jgi:hypothetical protein
MQVRENAIPQKFEQQLCQFEEQHLGRVGVHTVRAPLRGAGECVMGLRGFALVAVSSLALFGALGCHEVYVAQAPPPPPTVQVPPIVQLADHNGFETGRGDGERAAVNGWPPEPRRSRAYAETPGYDRHLGPFDVYQNEFRLAYLRGFDKGYRREAR